MQQKSPNIPSVSDEMLRLYLRFPHILVMEYPAVNNPAVFNSL